MRLCTFRTATGTRAGRVDGDAVVELDAPDVGAVLAHPDTDGLAAADGPRHPLAGLDLAPVVTAPGKVLCVGLNYASHIAEMGRERPTAPTLFAKFADALVGAGDDVPLPPESDRVDWEGELALIVGRPVRRASDDEAAAAIAGFTVCNDVTMRDWQRRTMEWLQGKAWTGSTPLGPWLATPDELGGVRPDVRLTVDVDGEVVQSATTSDLVFDPVALVAYVSTFTTLAPGDVIITGTPSGVGDGRTPPRYIQDGETVRVSIEGIGEVRNRFVRERTAG